MGEVTFCRSPKVADAELSELHSWAFGEQPAIRPWADQLSAHSLGWVCAYDGDLLVGFVNVAWDGDLHAFVLDTAVHPDHQRQGTGSGLVREAMALAREAGCRYVHVDTGPELLGFYLAAPGMVTASAATAELAELPGTTAGVVRVGATVRKPYGPWVPTVHALLGYLGAHGFPSPRPLGVDQEGRQVLSWLPGRPGWLEHHRCWRSPDMLAKAARLVRRLHELLDAYPVPRGPVWRGGWGRPIDGSGSLCHHDLGPWNFVVDASGGLAVIDWDGIGPGDRMAELAYCIAGFAPLKRDSMCAELGWRTPPPRALRVELFRAAYGLPDNERPELADAIIASARSGAEFGETMHAEGKEPWASIWAADHGAGDREDLAVAESSLAAWRKNW